MNGKQKCKILKEIRAEIARSNDIEYVTSECKHKGDCKGTCPKCEAELRYLEKELERKQQLGKAVAIMGMSASITLSAAGCVDLFPQTDGDLQPPPEEELMGDIAIEEYKGVMVESTEGELIEEPFEGELSEDAVE